jgi:hypothetical protein
VKRAFLLASLLLCACQPQPRAPTYFEAHPREAAAMLRSCASGARRGVECVNAKAAMAAIGRKRRMESYRRGFE